MHLDFDKNYYPYYGMLTEKEQALYRTVLPYIRNAKRSVPVKTDLRVTSQEAFNVIESIYYDRPEIFWLSNHSTAVITGSHVSEISLEYNHYVNTLAARKNQFHKAIQEFISGLAGKKPYEQELIIHDRMVRQISYISHSTDQTAFAALVNKKAVCAGYTRAFQVLLCELDIPCYYCVGKSLSRESSTWGDHAWNIIRLENDYYNVDITWDDGYERTDPGKISYTYYNCTDRQIAASHIRDEKSTPLPVCNGTKYRFESVTGIQPELAVIYQDGVTCKTPVHNKEEYFKLVRKHLTSSNAGIFRFSFHVEGSKVIENATSWLSEIGKSIFPGKGFSCQAQWRDYQNGWYLLTLTLELK